MHRFFHWYCHPDYQEDIEGDLLERFEIMVEEKGIQAAKWRFAKDVLLLFRPGIIRSLSGTRQLNNYGMFKNYFKISWRNLLRNKSYSIINIIGLSLSIACVMLIFTLVKYHLNFDAYHGKVDSIYRITTEFHMNGIGYSSGVPSPMGEAFRNDFTFAEKVASVASISDRLVSVPSFKEKKFEEDIAFAEPTFFEILKFPLVRGNHNTPLSEPNEAFITQSIAKKIFGEEDPMGKTIPIDNKLDVTVSGILKDLPANTDRQQEIYLHPSAI